MAIEIVDLPINSMVIFHSFLYVYQRVPWLRKHPWSILILISEASDCNFPIPSISQSERPTEMWSEACLSTRELASPYSQRGVPWGHRHPTARSRQRAARWCWCSPWLAALECWCGFWDPYIILYIYVYIYMYICMYIYRYIYIDMHVHIVHTYSMLVISPCILYLMADNSGFSRFES